MIIEINGSNNNEQVDRQKGYIPPLVNKSPTAFVAIKVIYERGVY